jgi:hypothetical protein
MLAAAAFDGGLDPAAFHTAPSHEEALARIEWLLDKRQRCGLVVADPGMGKSHLAAAAARRLGGLGAETAVLSLRGLPEGEWLDLLLARLPLDPASRGEVIRPWLKLENRSGRPSSSSTTSTTLRPMRSTASPDSSQPVSRGLPRPA